MSRRNCQGLIQLVQLDRCLFVVRFSAASVFPTVVKYVLKLFAMSVLSVQGIPLDVINVSVTVVFLFLFFSIWPIVSHVFFYLVDTRVPECTCYKIVKPLVDDHPSFTTTPI